MSPLTRPAEMPDADRSPPVPQHASPTPPAPRAERSLEPATTPIHPRFGPPTTANPFWRVVVLAGAAFCLSCLLWITASFGNPAAPGTQWLNRHGLMLIIVTAAAAISAAVTSMIVDQRQTQRLRQQDEDRSSRLPAMASVVAVEQTEP